jgi:tetratricopeptide (TPR) repeat protein
MLESNLYHLVIRDPRFYPLDERAILDLGITATLMVQLHLTYKEETKKESLPNRGRGSNPNMVDPEEYRRHVPRSALKEFDKGVKQDREGKADEAIRHYEKALSIAPDFYPAHNNLGSAYLRKSDFAGAQKHFEEAIRLNQSDAQARLNLANVFLQTKRYDEALLNVEEGLRREPNSPLGLFLRGSIYENMGRFQEAERNMRQALEADPSMSRVHLELVNLYLAQRKTPEATAELRTFLKDFPNDPMAPRAKEVLKKLED